MNTKKHITITEDKTDPIKWAQPRVVNTTVIYKPTIHPRERDLKTFRSAPSLVTGGHV